MLFGCIVFITLNKYAFWGVLDLGRSGIYLIILGLFYALSHTVFVHISLYLGTSSTQRTLASFNKHLFPQSTFLANSVVMSLAEGQYLWRLSIINKKYLLLTLIHEEITKCIDIRNPLWEDQRSYVDSRSVFCQVREYLLTLLLILPFLLFSQKGIHRLLRWVFLMFFLMIIIIVIVIILFFINYFHCIGFICLLFFLFYLSSLCDTTWSLASSYTLLHFN